MDPRVRRETECLAQRGDQLDVFCLRAPGKPAREIAGNIRLYRIVKKQASGNCFLKYLGFLQFLIVSFLWVSFYHYQRRYDCVHVHNVPDLLVFSALVPRRCGAKLILDLHENMPELFMQKFHKPEDHWAVRAIKFSEKRAVQFADHVIAATPFIRAKIISAPPCSIFPTPPTSICIRNRQSVLTGSPAGIPVFT